MRRRLIALLPLLLATLAVPGFVAGPAAAQRQVCSVVEGGRPICTSSYDDLADRLNRQSRLRGEDLTAQPAAPAEIPAPFITREQRRLVDNVARAVLKGRCARARELAIAAGDLDLAAAAAVRCDQVVAEQKAAASTNR